MVIVPILIQMIICIISSVLFVLFSFARPHTLLNRAHNADTVSVAVIRLIVIIIKEMMWACPFRQWKHNIAGIFPLYGAT